MGVKMAVKRLAFRVAIFGMSASTLFMATALPAHAATINRTRTASCWVGSIQYIVTVAWKDYGTTVEPQGITLDRQPTTPMGLAFDYTVKYRPGDNGTPWYTRSGSYLSARNTPLTFYPASAVASHSESSLPNVQVHIGPWQSTSECFARVNLY
jgi:hypothetical protein